MTRADAELMRAIEENPRRAAESLVVRVHQAQQAMQFSAQMASLGQVAASLFVAAEADVTVPTITLSGLFSQCFQPGVREAIDSGSRREVPRKMLGTIISRTDDLTAFQAMSVASQFKLPEGIVPATRVLKNYDGRNGAALAQRAGASRPVPRERKRDDLHDPASRYRSGRGDSAQQARSDGLLRHPAKSILQRPANDLPQPASHRLCERCQAGRSVCEVGKVQGRGCHCWLAPQWSTEFSITEQGGRESLAELHSPLATIFSAKDSRPLFVQAAVADSAYNRGCVIVRP
ncbi:MAG: hypothetical protein JF612_12350 [Planctomycetia bacterium]|nr:hypothetical protein [Planctomycetia bacterium]